ncbi:DUF3135 domain-containing protein [Sulfuriflexus mobilis]|uniref:DUF3135 domain-containing protein n=1 Tax=Sulfuriflexus mobilis TaxID=1811807 RepID=UPI000F84A316|nr:DUF3135 domain-containing protein [Sulfuriflexus mobilis]
MNSSLFTEMGFDDWCDLASKDPEAFETARDAVIEEFLASIPGNSRKRLRCLQWRIDMIRQRSSNPMAACLDIYSMMWDRLAGEKGMLETMQSMDSRRPGPSPQTAAKILPFQCKPGKTD